MHGEPCLLASDEIRAQSAYVLSEHQSIDLREKWFSYYASPLFSQNNSQLNLYYGLKYIQKYFGILPHLLLTLSHI